MSFSDEKIKLISRGNTEAFKELYDYLFPFLSNFTLQLVKDKDEATDIVQEALLVYWNKRSEFEKLDTIKAYLYSTIKNMGFNYLRSQKVHAKHLAFIENQDNHYFKNKIIEEETKTIIRNTLSELPEQTRTIIELSMQGAKNNDIAEALKVSVNTIKTLKLRAYKVLREKLKEHVYALIVLIDILF